MDAGSSWLVYLLECGDGSLYCGVTNRLEARLRAHARGTGARYTRGRGPLRLRYVERAPDRAAALRREREVKALRRGQKEALIAARPLPAEAEAAAAALAAAPADG